MPNNVVSWVLTAKDQTAGAFGSVQGRLARVGLDTKTVSKSGLAMGAGFIAGGVLIAKGLDSAIQKTMDFDNAFAGMNRRIGATGKEAQAWDSVFRKVYSDGPAATLDSVSTALGFLGANLRGTKQDAEAFALSSFKLARIQGEEVQPIVESLAQSFTKWGIPLDQVNQKADVLASVSQKSGVSINELLNTALKGQPIFKTLNLSFDESVGLIGQFKRAGIESTRVISGLSVFAGKLAKKMVDNKDKTGEYSVKEEDLNVKLQGTGLKMQSLAGKMADLDKKRNAGKLSTAQYTLEHAKLANQIEGVKVQEEGLRGKQADLNSKMAEAKKPVGSLREEFKRIFAEIKAAKDPTQALGLAMKEGFAGRTATQLVAGIRSGAISFDQLDGALKHVKGGLDKTLKGNITLQGRMDAMKRQVDLAKEALGRGLTPVLAGVIVPLSKLVKTIAEFLVQHPAIAKMVSIFAALAAVLLTLGGVAIILNQMRVAMEGLKVGIGIIRALNLAVAAAPWILLAIAVAVVAYLIITHWSTVKKWFLAFWHWLNHVWQDIFAKVKGAWNAIYGFMKKTVGGIIDWIKNHWRLLLVILTGPIGLAVGLITKYWDDIKNAAANAWHAITGIVKKAFSPISGFVHSQLNVLKKWWTQHGAEVKQLVREFLGAIKKFFQVTFGWISGLVRGELAIMRVAWGVFWNVLKVVAGAAWAVLKVMFAVGFAVLKAILTPFVAVFKAIWSVMWSVIKVVARAAFAALRAIWDIGFAIIKTIVRVAWQVIKTIFTTQFNAIKLAVQVVWDVIGGIFRTARDIILGVVGAFLDVLTGNFGKAWNTIKDTVTTVVGDVWNTVSTVFNRIKDFLFGLVGSFADVSSKIGHAIIDGLLGIIRGAGGLVGSAVHGIIDHIPGIGLIKKVPGLGWLAQGGIVNYPTSGGLAVLHGKEAVLPLNDPDRTLALLGSPEVMSTLSRSAFMRSLENFSGRRPTTPTVQVKATTTPLGFLGARPTTTTQQPTRVNIAGTNGFFRTIEAIRRPLPPLSEAAKKAQRELNRLNAMPTTGAFARFNKAILEAAKSKALKAFLAALDPARRAAFSNFVDPNRNQREADAKYQRALAKFKRLNAIKVGATTSLGGAAINALKMQAWKDLIATLTPEKAAALKAFFKKIKEPTPALGGGRLSGGGGGGGLSAEDSAKLSEMVRQLQIIVATLNRYDFTLTRAINNLATNVVDFAGGGAVAPFSFTGSVSTIPGQGATSTLPQILPPPTAAPVTVVPTGAPTVAPTPVQTDVGASPAWIADVATLIGSQVLAANRLAPPAEILVLQREDEHIAQLLQRLINMPRVIDIDVHNPKPEPASTSIQKKMQHLSQQGRLG